MAAKSLTSGLITQKDAPALVRRLKRRGTKIVFTNGVFDILHRGHVEYLAAAKSLGDVLVVGLNTDASVRRLKGAGRPLQKMRDRAIILLALESVDYVIPFGDDTPKRLIETVAPDVLVKGADYKIKDIVGAEFVLSHGGRVHRIRLTSGRSSSKIIDRF